MKKPKVDAVVALSKSKAEKNTIKLQKKMMKMGLDKVATSNKKKAMGDSSDSDESEKPIDANTMDIDQIGNDIKITKTIKKKKVLGREYH